MARAAYIDDFEKWRQGFQFSYAVQVRFSETDMFGHLNNTIPFTYFEVARIEFLKKIGFMADWLKPNSDTIPVVADLQCDFLSQVYFDEKLLIHVKAETIGNSSADLHYLGTKEDGTVCFTGRGMMVQIARSTGKAQAMTEEMRTLLLKSSQPR